MKFDKKFGNKKFGNFPKQFVPIRVKYYYDREEAT